VHVGDDSSPYGNQACNTVPLTTVEGSEVSCNLAGQYVSVVRPTKDRLVLTGVAVFIDCDSPDLPWDTITGFPMELNLNETKSVGVSLLTELETALGEDVCNQLDLEIIGLPPFCNYANGMLTCSPTLEDHHDVLEASQGFFNL